MEEIRLKHKIDIPQDIMTIKEVFTKNGFKLFLVGGAVRDTLLKHKIKDYDLATDAHPTDVNKMISQTEFQVIPVGEAFGVMNVVTSEDQYEIATFRSDGDYLDNRRPENVTFSDIRTDAERRDLTINALYYDIDSEEIVDFVGGIADIENMVINTVGSAKDRFNEDILRVMRAIRFATRLGFKMSDEISKELAVGYDLSGISKKRIRDEFLKSVKSAQDVNELMFLYRTFNLTEQILRGCVISLFVRPSNDPIILLAHMLRLDMNVSKKLNELGYTNDEVKKISFLIDMFENLHETTAPSLKKRQLIAEVTNEQMREFWGMIHRAPNIVEAFIKYELTVSGKDVMTPGGLIGAQIGAEIARLESIKFLEILDSVANE